MFKSEFRSTFEPLFDSKVAIHRQKVDEMFESWVCSSEKARKDFGFETKKTLEQGVNETIAWYRQNKWV